MDFGLYARVLWRFRLLVGLGFVAAGLLAVLTVAKISPGVPPKFAARQQPTYRSVATLLLTQPGFPWGSAIQSYTTPKDSPPVAVGDAARMTGLTNLYVALANSDAVKQLRRHLSRLKGKTTAAASYATLPSGYEVALPEMTLTGTSDSRAHATALTRAGIDAFRKYLAGQQDAAHIPKNQRVVIQALGLTPPAKVGGPKKTLPVVVFLIVMMAVVGLALVLENIRPRVSVQPVADALPIEVEAAHDSAQAHPA